MKKRFMILPLVLVLCYVSGCQQAEQVAEEPAVDMEAERVAFGQTIEALIDAYNLKDVDALLALMADDALLTRGGEFFWHKAQLGEYVSGEYSRGNFWTVYPPEKLEVSASGDLAYAVHRYEYTWVEEDESKTSKNSFTTIWKKQVDGRWKMVSW